MNNDTAAFPHGCLDDQGMSLRDYFASHEQLASLFYGAAYEHVLRGRMNFIDSAIAPNEPNSDEYDEASKTYTVPIKVVMERIARYRFMIADAMLVARKQR